MPFRQILGWSAFLFLAPAIYVRFGTLSLLPLVLAGAYFFVGLTHALHEAWHGYFVGYPRDALMRVLGACMGTHSQIYSLVHRFHHQHTHTYRDLEFYPFGRIQNLWLRRLNNFLEVSLGMIYMQVLTFVAILKNPRLRMAYSHRAGVQSIGMSVLFFGGLCVANHWFFGVPPWGFGRVLWLSIWAGSLITHHEQLFEHGGIITAEEGSDVRRTRNLRIQGPASRLVNILTHGSLSAHALHHARSGENTRLLGANLESTTGAELVSLGEYFWIAVRFVWADLPPQRELNGTCLPVRDFRAGRRGSQFG